MSDSNTDLFMCSDWCLPPRQTSRLTVGRNVTLIDFDLRLPGLGTSGRLLPHEVAAPNHYSDMTFNHLYIYIYHYVIKLCKQQAESHEVMQMNVFEVRDNAMPHTLNITALTWLQSSLRL
jgi:hypothetical protein